MHYDFQKATGKTIDEWQTVVASELRPLEEVTHKEMASFLVSKGVDPWWAQGVTVAIEKAIGRRVVGQTCNGTFSASASKTIQGDWLELFDAFCNYMDANPQALPMPAEGDTRQSATDKWRYWRADLSDGSKVAITLRDISTDKAQKASFGVNHDKLESLEHREEMKKHWKKALSEFSSSLS